MQISINKKELKKIIKEAIKEVVEEEGMENFLESIPPVSKQEMEEINKLYGNPAKKKEPAYSEESVYKWMKKRGISLDLL